MTMLYLALAYMVGIGVGRWMWERGLLQCEFPSWLWYLPLGVLFCVPLLHRWEKKRALAASLPLRWPTSAGFVPPSPPLSLALSASLILCLLTGIFRYAAHPLTPCWTPADLAYYNLPASHAFDRQAASRLLEGHIHHYPTQEDGRHQLQVAVERMIVDGAPRPVDGLLSLQIRDNRRYRYGQAVRLSGRLTTPPDFEDFSYREYLARSGIHSILHDAQIEVQAEPPAGLLRGGWHYLYALRGQGEKLLNQSLPEPTAALANGMLLGIDSGIPDALYDQFNLAGISHVLVISGSNVALVAAVALALSQRVVGQKWAVYPALTAITLYALLVGGDAAVLRAAVMGGLVVVAGAINRPSTALIGLAAAAACLTLINPLILWDVGFQLSGMATAGLILFTPAITAWIVRLLPNFQGGVLTATRATSTTTAQAPAPSSGRQTLFYSLILESLIVTLAANIMVLPLIVFYFGRLSVISIVANLLVAALQPLILLSGMAGILVGLLGLGLIAEAVLWVTWLGLQWTTLVAKWTAQLPGASLAVTTYGWAGLVITYGLIGALRFGGHRIYQVYKQLGRGWRNRARWMHRLQPLLLGGLGLVVVSIWGAVATLPDGKLHIYFLNVDGGTGTLIQTPMGRQILIDGGPISQRLISELGAVMPFWDRTLDLMVVTQPNSPYDDALAQIPRRWRIGHALHFQDTGNDQWRTSLQLTETPITPLQQGGWVDLGDGVALWVLGPPHAANASGDEAGDQAWMLKIVYDEFSLLMTGDNRPLDPSTSAALGVPLQANLLQVIPQKVISRSGDVQYGDLVASVDPEMIVIHGGGALRDSIAPAQGWIPLTGRRLLQTAQAGRTHIYTDGQNWWLESGGKW